MALVQAIMKAAVNFQRYLYSGDIMSNTYSAKVSMSCPYVRNDATKIQKLFELTPGNWKPFQTVMRPWFGCSLGNPLLK